MLQDLRKEAGRDSTTRRSMAHDGITGIAGQVYVDALHETAATGLLPSAGRLGLRAIDRGPDETKVTGVSPGFHTCHATDPARRKVV